MKEGGFKDIEDQYIKLIQEQKYVYQKGYVFLIPSFPPSRYLCNCLRQNLTSCFDCLS